MKNNFNPSGILKRRSIIVTAEITARKYRLCTLNVTSFCAVVIFVRTLRYQAMIHSSEQTLFSFNTRKTKSTCFVPGAPLFY